MEPRWASHLLGWKGVKAYRVKVYGQFCGPFAEEEVVAMYQRGEINLATPFQIVGADESFELDELLPLMKLEQGPVRWLDVTYDHGTTVWTAAAKTR